MRGPRKVATAASIATALALAISTLGPPGRAQTPPGSYPGWKCFPAPRTVCYTCENSGNLQECEYQIETPPGVIGHCRPTNPPLTTTCHQRIDNCGKMFRCGTGEQLPYSCGAYHVCFDGL
ncbi:MAG: hypothetical protein KatS3mg108_0143 [Isosphaeraceae bacterium]|jgi:hypothetical protein|nr:MAG: hypothetical protein KatS3mg108_0143 [Isosphaeraceae bacterium]